MIILTRIPVFIGPIRDLMTIVRDEKIGRRIGSYNVFERNYLILCTFFVHSIQTSSVTLQFIIYAAMHFYRERKTLFYYRFVFGETLNFCLQNKNNYKISSSNFDALKFSPKYLKFH